MATVNDLIQHAGEAVSNDVRKAIAKTEPVALRTFTSTLAVLAKSSGSYHWTPEGHRLADFSSGVLVANLGHHPSRWWRQVLSYLNLSDLENAGEFVEGVTLSAYNAITEIEARACARLLDNLRGQAGGERMEQVFWAASGSEAIQKALWAAMKFRPGRDRIIATRGGFHGKKGLAGAITGSESDPERDPRVSFISFPKEECHSVERRRQPIDLTRYEQELQQLADAHGSQLACLVTEPYLGGGGSYHPQPEYLQLLERFCRKHDLLLILDEIQSNFGRTGPMYAFTHYGITPDIVCLGKGLGNGVPVAAAVGRADVFAALKHGEGSDTYSANPLAVAGVLATLDLFESEDVIARGQALSGVIEQGLLRLRETSVIGNVRGEGCVWGIECQSLGQHTSQEVANLCVSACYEGDSQGRRIHLLGPLAGNVLRISPPLVMPCEEAEAHFDAMHEIFTALAARLQ